VRFPEPFKSLQQARVTRASLAGNAGVIARGEAEISAVTASIAGVAGPFDVQKAAFLLGF